MRRVTGVQWLHLHSELVYLQMERRSTVLLCPALTVMVFVLHSGAVVFVKFTKRWGTASWAMRDQHRGVPQLLRLGTTDQADICRNPQPSESYCITACLSGAASGSAIRLNRFSCCWYATPHGLYLAPCSPSSVGITPTDSKVDQVGEETGEEPDDGCGAEQQSGGSRCCDDGEDHQHNCCNEENSYSHAVYLSLLSPLDGVKGEGEQWRWGAELPCCHHHDIRHPALTEQRVNASSLR